MLGMCASVYCVIGGFVCVRVFAFEQRTSKNIQMNLPSRNEHMRAHMNMTINIYTHSIINVHGTDTYRRV